MSIRLVAGASALALSSVAFGQQAVQWRVEDGGNGHWYALASNHASQAAARSQAEQVGGTLLMLDTIGEQDFILSLQGFPDGNNGVWLGMRLGLAGWVWDNGVGVTGISWCAGNPCTPCDEPIALLLRKSIWGTGVADAGDPHCCPPHPKAMIEWSADCDGNGVVDYGEILDGTLEDTNANGIPDCCEGGQSCGPCDGDLNDDNRTDGADISVLLGFWGQTGKSVLGDIDGNHVVDAADLSALLASWGPCP